MQGQILLNMLAHSGPLPQDKIEGQEMHTILLNLEGQRFVEQTQIGDRWAVTADGQHQLESLLREAESYHTRYDIFKDVFYERGTPVEFESEIGKDLRADVIESEGLDPVRVLFVQLLMGGSVQMIEWPKDRRAIEIGDVVISNEKIKERLDWVPIVGLEDGLKHTFDYFKDNLDHYLK